MFAYLIASKQCYGNFSKKNLDFFTQKVHNSIAKLDYFNNQFSVNIKLKYIALRYDNTQILSDKEIFFIESCFKLCSKLNISLLINLSFKPIYNLEILHKYGILVGIHIKDSNILSIKNINISSSIFYSAHSIKNANLAIEYGANFITLSPIFYDKYNKALGVNFLHNLDSNLKKKVIALGGINTDSRILEIQKCDIAGFASISYFCS